MVKEYIEKEAFKQYLLDLKKQVNEIVPGQSVISGTTLSELIDRFPAAADVVEVVRCKDCKHRKYEDFIKELVCDLDAVDPYERSRCAEDDEWFCKDGERKDG